MNSRFLIILFLLIPLIPTSRLFFLRGATTAPEKVPLTLSSVWTGKYQEWVEGHFARHVGFYAPLINLDNMINLAFSETRLNSNGCVVIAHNDVLLSPDEVALFRQRKVDWPAIEKKIQLLSEASQKLKKLGIEMKLVFVPSKLSYFVKELPERWQVETPEPRPGLAAVQQAMARLQSLQVPILDVRDILEKIRKETGEIGYPRGGRHLYQLASCEILGMLQKPNFTCFPAVPGVATGNESDIHECLNSFHPFGQREKLSKPGPVQTERKAPRKVLLVGSSFMRELETEARRLKLYEDLHIFYYNKSHENGVSSKPVKIDDEWRNLIKSRDLIVVDFFEPQLDTLGHGFAEQVLREL